MPGKQRYTLAFKTQVPQVDGTYEVSFRGAYGNREEAAYFGKIAASGSAGQLQLISATPVRRLKIATFVPPVTVGKVTKASEYFAARVARMNKELAELGKAAPRKGKKRATATAI